MHNRAQRQLRLSPGTNTNSYTRDLDSKPSGIESKNHTALAARAKLELARTAQTVNKEHKRGLSMKTHILPQVGAPSPSSHSRYHARSNIFTNTPRQPPCHCNTRFLRMLHTPRARWTIASRRGHPKVPPPFDPAAIRNFLAEVGGCSGGCARRVRECHQVPGVFESRPGLNLGSVQY